MQKHQSGDLIGPAGKGITERHDFRRLQEWYFVDRHRSQTDLRHRIPGSLKRWPKQAPRILDCLLAFQIQFVINHLLEVQVFQFGLLVLWEPRLCIDFISPQRRRRQDSFIFLDILVLHFFQSEFFRCFADGFPLA